MPDTFVPLVERHDRRPAPFARTVASAPTTTAVADVHRFEVDAERVRATRPTFDLSGHAAIPDALLRAARERACDEGRSAGYAAGLEAARQATAQDLADAAAARALAALRAAVEVGAALQAVRAAARRLEEQTATVTAALADQTLDAVASLTTAVLGHALARGEDSALDAVRRALDPLPGAGPVVVRLAPTDAEIVQRATAAARCEDLDAAWGGRELTVVADASLARGDAVACSGVTEVDARLDASLGRALAALRS